jgi:TolB-like protein/Tfp pilus assembly protein PilF
MLERWQRVQALFNAALEQPPEARSAYVTEACGDDAELRREVEELLMADSEAAALETEAGLRRPVNLALDDAGKRLALVPGTRFGPYEIIAPLGAGGMGVVYCARDTRLQRTAAIKLVSAVEDDTARARLLREARHASALNHPNICTIYEVGEAEGHVFVAMEYVEGRPLSALIPPRGLPAEAVLRYGMQIADALAHAHERGIVHLDLKSGNIISTPEGGAKVLDFGLAKRVAGPPLAGAEPITMTGTIAGTVSYMAPEVLRGEPPTARADMWALGVVLFEMASGKLPFRAQTSFEVMAAILHEPAQRLPSSVLPGLRAIIQRCLEKDPTRRYARAGEVRAALELVQEELRGHGLARPAWPARRVQWAAGIAGLIVLFLLAGGAAILNVGSWRERLIPEGGGGARIASIAVLPLDNLSRDPEQEYFADGLTDALITDLAQISTLRVISRTSVIQYRMAKKSVPQIARELNVDAVVEGSVLRVGDRVRITAQLIHGSAERHLWARSYERGMQDILGLQSEIARAIADEIKVTLTPEDRARLSSSRVVDPEAYQQYLRGRYLLNQRSERTTNEAIRYFERAIQRDPTYASAYSGLADCYATLGDSNDVGSLPPNDAIPKAKAAVTRALELDDTRAEAHNSLAFIHLAYDWNWRAAETEFKRALELNARLADAHHWYAHLLIVLGRPEQALAESERALDLDALNPILNTHLGWHHVMTRQSDKAIDQFAKTLDLFPDAGLAFRYRAWAFEQKRAYAQALPDFENARRLLANNVMVLADLGHSYAVSGNARDARRIIEELAALARQRYVPSMGSALIYSGLGDRDRAFQWLDNAFRERSEWLIYLNVDPRFDPLRADPRFRELQGRVGLPAEAHGHVTHRR